MRKGHGASILNIVAVTRHDTLAVSVDDRVDSW